MVTASHQLAIWCHAEKDTRHWMDLASHVHCVCHTTCTFIFFVRINNLIKAERDFHNHMHQHLSTLSCLEHLVACAFRPNTWKLTLLFRAEAAKPSKIKGGNFSRQCSLKQSVVFFLLLAREFWAWRLGWRSYSGFSQRVCGWNYSTASGVDGGPSITTGTSSRCGR